MTQKQYLALVYFGVLVSLLLMFLSGCSNDRLGTPGVDGADGKPGIDGTNGKDGENGQDGKNGSDGKDGEDGEDGEDGTLATSQYSLSVDDTCVIVGSQSIKRYGANQARLYNNTTCTNSFETLNVGDNETVLLASGNLGLLVGASATMKLVVLDL